MSGKAKAEEPVGGDPYAGQRGEGGRFGVGNKGGPGRPPKAREAAYAAVLREILTLGEWGIIVRAAILRAQNGDAQARQWLTDYAIGRAPQAVDIRHVEGEEASLEEQFAGYSDEELLAILAAVEGGGTATANGGAGASGAGGASGVSGAGSSAGAGASEAG